MKARIHSHWIPRSLLSQSLTSLIQRSDTHHLSFPSQRKRRFCTRQLKLLQKLDMNHTLEWLETSLDNNGHHREMVTFLCPSRFFAQLGETLSKSCYNIRIIYKEQGDLGMISYSEYFPKGKFKDIRFDEPLKLHTSFKVGGPADVMIIPSTEEELIQAVKICRENDIKYFIMGNGSNLLVRDTGIRGVVIKINEGFDNVQVEGTKIMADR